MAYYHGRLSLKHHGGSSARWHSTRPLAAQPNGLSAQAKSIETSNGKHKAHKARKALDKDFFVSVIGASTTKRDAKAYLQNFKLTGKVVRGNDPSSRLQQSAVVDIEPEANRSNDQPRLVSEVRIISQGDQQKAILAEERQLHVALVKLQKPQELDDELLADVAATISQLNRLGLRSVVVINTHEHPRHISSDVNSVAMREASRFANILSKEHTSGSHVIQGMLDIVPTDHAVGTQRCQQKMRVCIRGLLLRPLQRGIIPVVPCVAFSESEQRVVSVDANETLITLTRELAGLNVQAREDEEPATTKTRMARIKDEVSLDRLIVIDALGGIPALDRFNGYHVFLNMQQEYRSVRRELSRLDSVVSYGPSSETGGEIPDVKITIRHSNELSSSARKAHLDSLDLVQLFLALLPPSSSALLTTPYEAANSRRKSDALFQPNEVGTRRQRNPLIHNLLTDKPILSPSLPRDRITSSDLSSLSTSITRSTQTSYALHSFTTFAKHGMPVTIFPDPHQTPWAAATTQTPALSLSSPAVDLPRLIHLIEDSFGRALDVPAYLARVAPRLAGVIIAGEYEGGALLTWELPPGVPDDGSAESRARMVPYLDKFAVLKRSQGAGGVADIVFRAMVNECLPGGVVWRSRKDNPVNKWYFERARSTYKLPDSNWTMFFTTSDVDMESTSGVRSDTGEPGGISRARFLDYVSICRSIEPSWTNMSGPVD